MSELKEKLTLMKIKAAKIRNAVASIEADIESLFADDPCPNCGDGEHEDTCKLSSISSFFWYTQFDSIRLYDAIDNAEYYEEHYRRV